MVVCWTMTADWLLPGGRPAAQQQIQGRDQPPLLPSVAEKGLKMPTSFQQGQMTFLQALPSLLLWLPWPPRDLLRTPAHHYILGPTWLPLRHPLLPDSKSPSCSGASLFLWPLIYGTGLLGKVGELPGVSGKLCSCLMTCDTSCVVVMRCWLFNWSGTPSW